jgi:hypothetical protein
LLGHCGASCRFKNEVTARAAPTIKTSKKEMKIAKNLNNARSTLDNWCMKNRYECEYTSNLDGRLWTECVRVESPTWRIAGSGRARRRKDARSEAAHAVCKYLAFTGRMRTG